jgi:Glycosyl hydrolases family 16
MTFLAVAAAAVLTASVMTAPALADTAVPAPFSWQGLTWCPTYRGGNGCDNVQSDRNSSSAFYPSQVTMGSGQIRLNMNASATQTGAFNTQTHESWSAPAILSETITLPCDSSGQIENWPAFWLVTPGAWPAGGEIDVVEGLHGAAAWHYHYLNASGQSSSAGGAVSGFSGCGTHTYDVSWMSSALTFYYDGVQVGQVTPAQIGVPIATGPMYVINDYMSSSTIGGPTTGGTTMQIGSFSAL